MKDKLHRELQESQIVVQVNYQKAILGVLRGGFTAGGQARYIELATGNKASSTPHNLIIISNEQAIEFAEGLIEILRGTLNFNQENEWHLNYYSQQIDNLSSCIRIFRKGLNGSHINYEKKR